MTTPAEGRQHTRQEETEEIGFDWIGRLPHVGKSRVFPGFLLYSHTLCAPVSYVTPSDVFRRVSCVGERLKSGV